MLAAMRAPLVPLLLTIAGAVIILIPLGLLMFHERLSLSKVLGAAFCLLGLALISRE
jgi:drug/metabolite transporter (DMT)-like permease